MTETAAGTAARVPRSGAGPARGRRGHRTAHTARQLAGLLGWSEGQMARALAAGILPAFDLKSPRWSGGLVEEIETDAERYAAAIPALVDAAQLRERLGLDYGQWRRGREAGVLPDGDLGDYYTPQAADALAARSAQVRAQIPPAPVGARRCAEHLAAATGRAVDYDDIADLAARGLTGVVDHFDAGGGRCFPLYDVAALDAVAADPAKVADLDAVIADRCAWISGSVTTAQALDLLPGWSHDDLARQARRRGITPGRLERWAKDDVAALAGDRDLVDQVRRDRLLWPREAAHWLGIRPSNFARLVDAGLLRSSGTAEWAIGGRRKRIATSAQYRLGDLEDLTAWPGADWAAARAAQPRDPSPFRELTARAGLIRRFCRHLGQTYGVQMSMVFRPAAGVWAVTWTPHPERLVPTVDDAIDILNQYLTDLEHTDDDIELEPAPDRRRPPPPVA